MAKWPNVPHCYGWLALNRRGRWLLDGRPLDHPNLIAFINRNYGRDGAGNWFFQNGPQRVYVALEYTPWVFRLTADGELESHTGIAVPALDAAWLDDVGNLLLSWQHGAALLDDRDLPTMFDAIRDASGAIPGEPTLAGFIDGKPIKLALHWRTQKLTLGFLRSADVPSQLGYIRVPAGT